MSLSNWSVTRIDTDGQNWRIAVNNPLGTSKTGNIQLFYDELGLTNGLVQINDATRPFLKVSPIGSGIKDYYIYAQRIPGDTYYYPPFVSWDNWTLTTSGWITNGLDDSIYGATGIQGTNKNDYANIPISWAVSGDPIDWSLSERTGVIAITGNRNDGTPLDSINNEYFVDSFFNSGQYIYVSSKEARVVDRSEFILDGSTSSGNLYLDNAYVDPTGGNTIQIATLYSTLYKNESSLTTVAQEIGYPLENIKINYEFSEQGGYSGQSIISEAPSPIKTYSGSLVGPQSMTGTAFDKVYFARNGYIEVNNASGLSSNDFCFLIDCTKKDSEPATLFSNMGDYSSDGVSGFEVGINSANYLYFKNYEEYKSSIYTFSKAGANRNLYYISAVGNSLQLGKFDFESSFFQIDTFSIQRNFQRDSDQWKIGSGEYNFSGYLNSFMYIEPFQQGGTQVNEFGNSFQQSVYSEAPVYDILPARITGYQTYATGNTGIIWYTGQLSGYVTGIYTGTQVTGTGIESTLVLKGQTGLTTSGDLYSGLHIYNGLLYFETNASGTGFYEVQSPTTEELSSITWHNNRKTLFGIEDNNSTVTEFNRRRQRVRTIPGNLRDAEGICYMSGNTLAFLDERDPNNAGSGAIYYGEITNSTSLIDTGALTKIPVAIDGSSNIGLEGLTFDTGRNCFYVVKEKTPASLYKVELNGNLTHYPAFNNLMSDYSDVFYEKNTDSLYILSDEDQKIIQTSMDAGIWYEKDVNISKPEGIAISEDLEKLYVCSDLTGQPGQLFVADQNKVRQYEFEEKVTGYRSGDFTDNHFLYLDQYNTGSGFSAVTEFVTGLEEFTYTGYDPVYIKSGITGYDGTTGYSYSGLTGEGFSFLVSGIQTKLLKNSNKFASYLYDSICAQSQVKTGDFLELQYPLLYPNLSYNNSGYGVSGEYISSNAPNYGVLNFSARYAFEDHLARPGFYISREYLTGEENIYLNGVIQRPGSIEYFINSNYEKIPYISGGDYAMTGTQVFDSGTGFLMFNSTTNELLYSDLNQPSETNGVSSQRVVVTDVSQYSDPVTLGISGLYNDIYLNGQKLYSGITYVASGHYFVPTGGAELITGNIYTTAKNTLLGSATGYGQFFKTGLFFENNISYLNGIRSSNLKVKTFSDESSLITGTKTITNIEELTLVYQKDFNGDVQELGFSEISSLPSWTWSGVTTGNPYYF